MQNYNFVVIIEVACYVFFFCQEAFVKYLEATASLCLDIAEKCKSTGIENSCSDYANQRMKLISHCYERAKSTQEHINSSHQIQQPSSSGSASTDSYHTLKPRWVTWNVA